jgi:hypothetical protein
VLGALGVAALLKLIFSDASEDGLGGEHYRPPHPRAVLRRLLRLTGRALAMPAVGPAKRLSSAGRKAAPAGCIVMGDLNVDIKAADT